MKNILKNQIEEDEFQPAQGIGLIFLWLHRAEKMLLITCLLVMIIMAFLNITLRNIGGGGIVWVDKLLINLTLWIAVIGSAISTKSNGHITIDVVSSFVPDQYHKYIHIITNLFAAVVCGFLTFHAYQLVAIIEYPAHQEFIPHIQTWVPIAIMPFGFAIMSLRFARLIVADLMDIISPRREP